MEHKHKAARSQHPAKPLEQIFLCDDNHHQRCNHNHQQGYGQQLPDEEIRLTAPLRQGLLQGADDVGIDHIHQCGKFLPVLGQNVGDSGKNRCRQITS